MEAGMQPELNCGTGRLKVGSISDEEMEVGEDRLSDIEDVVEKVTDKLGLCFDKIHPAVDPDKVILDLSPEEAEILNGTELFHRVDFPVRNLSEMVQFNLITDLRDSSSDSILSSNNYEVVGERNTFTHPDTPPSTPSPTTQVKDNSDPHPESQLEMLKRQSSEALSEKVVETMNSITNLLTGLEGQEGFEMTEDGYHIEDLVGIPVSLQSSIILDCESLSDVSRELDEMSVSSMPEVEDKLVQMITVEPPLEPTPQKVIPHTASELLEQEEKTEDDFSKEKGTTEDEIMEQKKTAEDEIMEHKEATEDEITEETTETISHEIKGCETCEELSAESLVSDPEPSVFITPQVMISVHSAPLLEDHPNTDNVGTTKVSESVGNLSGEGKPDAAPLSRSEGPDLAHTDNVKLEDDIPVDSKMSQIVEDDFTLGTIEITVDADQIIAVQGIDTSNDSLDVTDSKLQDLDDSYEINQPKKPEELKMIEEVEENPQKDEPMSDDDRVKREEILAELGQVFVRDESLHTSPPELEPSNEAAETLGAIVDDDESVPASITVSTMPLQGKNVPSGDAEDLSSRIDCKLAESSVDSLLTSDELESNPEVVQRERAPEVNVDLSLSSFEEPVIPYSEFTPSVEFNLNETEYPLTDQVEPPEIKKEAENSLICDGQALPIVPEHLDSDNKDKKGLASSSTDSILTPDEVDFNSEVVVSSKKPLNIDLDLTLSQFEKFNHVVADECAKSSVIEPIPAESNSEAEQILRSSSTSSSNSSYSSFEGADGQRIKIKRRRTSNYVDSAKNKEPIVHLELQLEKEQEGIAAENEIDQVELRNDLKRLLSDEGITVPLTPSGLRDSDVMNASVEPSDEQTRPEPYIKPEEVEIGEDLSEDIGDAEQRTDIDLLSESIELDQKETMNAIAKEDRKEELPQRLDEEPQSIPSISLNGGLKFEEDPVVEEVDQVTLDPCDAEKENVKIDISALKNLDPVVDSRVELKELEVEHEVSNDQVSTNDHDVTLFSPDVPNDADEPITPPQAVLRRNSGVSISSSSSESDSELYEVCVEQQFAAVKEVESDDSSICSASDLRESMRRFHEMKRSLSVDDCLNNSVEVVETDLEIVTPDLNLSEENHSNLYTTEIVLEHSHEECSPAPGDIHIPLSVILSSNSSRKSSSSSSDSGSEERSLNPEETSESNLEILTVKAIEKNFDITPNDRITDQEVRDFVNSQIEIALEKTLELEDNPKKTTQTEPENQISITNTTFSLLSDIPDFQLKHVETDNKIISRKSSSSSNSEMETEIPRIDIEEMYVKAGCLKPSTSSSENEGDCPQIDLTDIKSASRKSSSSSSSTEEAVHPEINLEEVTEINVSRKSSSGSDRETRLIEIEISQNTEDLTAVKDESAFLIPHEIIQSSEPTHEEPLKVSGSPAIEIEAVIHKPVSRSSSSSSNLKSGSESSLSSKTSSASKNVEEIAKVENVTVLTETVLVETDKEKPYGTLAIASETNSLESTPLDNPVLSKELSIEISQSSIASSSSSDKDSGSDGDGKTDLTEVTEIVEAEKLVLTYEDNPEIDAPQAVTMSKESPTIDKIKLVNTPEESPETDLLLLTEKSSSVGNIKALGLVEDSHTVDKTNAPEEGYLVIDKTKPEVICEQTPKDETSTTPDVSPAIENITVINTPDLLEAGSDSDSLSEEEGFCESDAMQSILDMMTGSTASMTGDDIEDELRSLSSSSSKSTVARGEEESADGATPEPASETADSRTPSPEVTEDFSRMTSAEPSEDMRTPSIEPAEVDEEATPEPPTLSSKPPAESPAGLPSYSVVSEDVDVKELDREEERKPDTIRQESSHALMILSLSQDSNDEITEDKTTSSKEQSEESPQSQTLNSSSLGTYDLSTTINTDPNLTIDSKEKLFLKTKWPKYDPVLGKSFALACKVRLRGFELRDQDIKSNASIRLYKDEDLLSVQPKFINGYFVFKIKSPTLADSGWYKFTVNMLDYEASEGQDINIALKGSKNKRTKSMSSIGSLGSLGSLFSVNNKTQNRR
ncbi:hypothetical protein ACHWQZ_G002684 [Mnemiopsis leidyi]